MSIPLDGQLTNFQYSLQADSLNFEITSYQITLAFRSTIASRNRSN